MMQRKNMLRSAWPLGAALILLSLAACGFQPPAASLVGGNAAGRAAQPDGQLSGYPYDVIQVVGFGQATGTPDVATLSLGVSVTADTVAEARGTAAQTVQSIMAALTEKNIAVKDITTSHFRVHPDYDYGDSGRKLKGYQVSNGLTVTVRNIGAVGGIIDAAIAAGGNDIVFNSLRFSFSDTAAMERQARQAAVANMKGKAAQLAQFSGRTLGDLMVISETPIGDVFSGRSVFGLEAAASAAYYDTPIAVGEGDITVTVYGVYELR